MGKAQIQGSRRLSLCPIMTPMAASKCCLFCLTFKHTIAPNIFCCSVLVSIPTWGFSLMKAKEYRLISNTLLRTYSCGAAADETGTPECVVLECLLGREEGDMSGLLGELPRIIWRARWDSDLVKLRRKKKKGVRCQPGINEQLKWNYKCWIYLQMITFLGLRRRT